MNLPWADIYLGIAAAPCVALAYLCTVYFGREAARLLRRKLKSLRLENELRLALSR